MTIRDDFKQTERPWSEGSVAVMLAAYLAIVFGGVGVGFHYISVVFGS